VDTGSSDASDEAQVMECVRAFDDALDGRDYQAVAELCADDFVFIGSGVGEECEGRDALGPMMSSLLSEVGARFVSWKLEFPEPYRITVHGDTAIVTRFGESELVMQGSRRVARYRLTGILRRTRDGWKWWLFHGSEAGAW
jgi:ketosteroid isomerase-like protein